MLFVGLLLGALVASPALAFNTYKLGGEDGNAWVAALSFDLLINPLPFVRPL